MPKGSFLIQDILENANGNGVICSTNNEQSQSKQASPSSSPASLSPPAAMSQSKKKLITRSETLTDTTKTSSTQQLDELMKKEYFLKNFPSFLFLNGFYSASNHSIYPPSIENPLIEQQATNNEINNNILMSNLLTNLTNNPMLLNQYYSRLFYYGQQNPLNASANDFSNDYSSLSKKIKLSSPNNKHTSLSSSPLSSSSSSSSSSASSIYKLDESKLKHPMSSLSSSSFSAFKTKQHKPNDLNVSASSATSTTTSLSSSSSACSSSSSNKGIKRNLEVANDENSSIDCNSVSPLDALLKLANNTFVPGVNRCVNGTNGILINPNNAGIISSTLAHHNIHQTDEEAFNLIASQLNSAKRFNNGANGLIFTEENIIAANNLKLNGNQNDSLEINKLNHQAKGSNNTNSNNTSFDSTLNSSLSVKSSSVVSSSLNNVANSKRKRKNRTAFTANQIYELEKRFNTQRYLSPHDRDRIAYELSLSTSQVITWFQNRRAKQKRDIEELKNDVNAAKNLKVIDVDIDVDKVLLRQEVFNYHNSNQLNSSKPLYIPQNHPSQNDRYFININSSSNSNNRGQLEDDLDDENNQNAEQSQSINESLDEEVEDEIDVNDDESRSIDISIEGSNSSSPKNNL